MPRVPAIGVDERVSVHHAFVDGWPASTGDDLPPQLWQKVESIPYALAKVRLVSSWLRRDARTLEIFPAWLTGFLPAMLPASWVFPGDEPVGAISTSNLTVVAGLGAGSSHRHIEGLRIGIGARVDEAFDFEARDLARSETVLLAGLEPSELPESAKGVRP